MVLLNAENMIKCTIVGDGMVGKTCLVKAFLGHKVPEKYVATIQEDYKGKIAVAGDKYHLLISDTSLQHDCEDEDTVSYKDTDVFIICYSVADRESFKSVKSFWLHEVRKESKRPVILVATQVDLLRDRSKYVHEAEGLSLAKAISAESFVKCSATKGQGLNEIFVNAVLAHIRFKKSKLAIIKTFFGR